MKKRQADLSTWLLILIGIGLLIYTGLRAATLSLTHDESSTFLNLVDQPVWECFFSTHCWGTANLHIVYTFFMQISVNLFGPSEFFIRLPSVLAHALYLFYSGLLVRKVSGRLAVRLAGFLLLNSNPFLLEFFALARGYGMACAFTMMSLYYLYVYLEENTDKGLWGCLIAAVLAVLSNFTFLNFYAALIGTLGIHLLLTQKHRHVFPWALMGGSGVLLLILLYVPINHLRQLGEFQYGIDSLKDTLKYLVWDSLQNEGYLGGATSSVFAGLSLAMVAGSILYAIIEYRREGEGLRKFQTAASLILILLLLGLVAQYYLLGTRYLVHRTALILIPVMGLPVVLALSGLAERRANLIMGFCILLSLFFTLHFARTANLVESREWAYDAYTRDMVEYVAKKSRPGNKINLGVDWHFSHSTSFYRQTRKLDFLEPILYDKNLRTDSLFDYYYIEPEDGNQLHADYVVEKAFGKVGVLYRRSE